MIWLALDMNVGTIVKVTVCVPMPSSPAGAGVVSFVLSMNLFVTSSYVTIFVLSKRGISCMLPLPSSTTMNVALVIFSVVWSWPSAEIW